MDSGTLTWRLSPSEVGGKELKFQSLPLQPIAMEYDAGLGAERFTMTFINVQFDGVGIILEDELVKGMVTELEADRLAEVEYQLEHSYVHPVSKNVVVEEYTFLGCALIKSFDNIRYSYGIGLPPTFKICFGCKRLSVASCKA